MIERQLFKTIKWIIKLTPIKDNFADKVLDRVIFCITFNKNKLLWKPFIWLMLFKVAMPYTFS